MRIWKVIVFVLVVALLGLGIYDLIQKKKAVEREVNELTENLSALESEKALLLADIEYYKRPENLIKEVKSQFNYKEEGEKLIIVVPGIAASSTKK